MFICWGIETLSNVCYLYLGIVFKLLVKSLKGKCAKEYVATLQTIKLDEHKQKLRKTVVVNQLLKTTK